MYVYLMGLMCAIVCIYIHTYVHAIVCTVQYAQCTFIICATQYALCTYYRMYLRATLYPTPLLYAFVMVYVA